MKTLVILLLVLLCLLPATQSLAQQTNFLDAFMDDKRKGLWAVAELGYATGSIQYSIPLLDFEDTSKIQGDTPTRQVGVCLLGKSGTLHRRQHRCTGFWGDGVSPEYPPRFLSRR